MKTILVPTDFSQVADNAINYAAEIARVINARIVLLHAFHIPVVTADVPVVMPDIQALESDCMESLKKIEDKLRLRFGKDLTVECVCRCGFAVDEIQDYTSAHKVDLIVMGMQGAGYLAEKLIGSITTAMLRKSKCPVLAIDREVKYRDIKKIAFACDYVDTNNKKPLESLKNLASLFKAHVYVLNVIREPELVPSTTTAVSDFIGLEDSLGDVEHTFHYFKNDEVVNGINEFVAERKIDMVAMIPRQHNLLEKIFSEPKTKKMAFHSKVPLLALH